MDSESLTMILTKKGLVNVRTKHPTIGNVWDINLQIFEAGVQNPQKGTEKSTPARDSCHKASRATTRPMFPAYPSDQWDFEAQEPLRPALQSACCETCEFLSSVR
jgi:hypothetical protein